MATGVIDITREKLNTIVTASANTSKNVSVPNNYKAVWFCIGSNNWMGAWLINCTSSGTVGVFQIAAQAHVSVSANGVNTVKVTNDDVTNPDIYGIEFSGYV